MEALKNSWVGNVQFGWFSSLPRGGEEEKRRWKFSPPLERRKLNKTAVGKGKWGDWYEGRRCTTRGAFKSINCEGGVGDRMNKWWCGGGGGGKRIISSPRFPFFPLTADPVTFPIKSCSVLSLSFAATCDIIRTCSARRWARPCPCWRRSSS